MIVHTLLTVPGMIGFAVGGLLVVGLISFLLSL